MPYRRTTGALPLHPARSAAGVVFFLFASLASLPADDWPAFRGGPSRSGVGAESLPPPFTPLWSAPVEGRLLAPPVAAGGRVFAGTDAGRLIAFDAADGRPLWAFAMDGPIEGAPAVDAGIVFIGSLGGDLCALRTGTGGLLWRVRHGGAQESSPLVLADRVIVAVGRPSRALHAYSKQEGTLCWDFAPRHPIDSSGTRVRAGGRDVVVAGDAGGVWSVIDAVAGPAPGRFAQWSLRLPTGQRAPTAAASAADGRFAVAPGGADRRVYLLDAAAHTVSRRIALPPADAAAEAAAAGDFAAMLELPADIPERIFGGDAEETAAALDLAELLLGRPLDALRDALANAAAAEAFPPVFDGRTLFVLRRERRGTDDVLVLSRADADSGTILSGWVSDPVSGPVSAPILAGGRLILAAGSDLWIFDPATLHAGPVDRLALPAPAAASPAASDGRLFVAGADGVLRAFAASNRPPGAPGRLEPAGGVNVASHYPSLRWSQAADPDAADAPDTLTPLLEYRVDLGAALNNGIPPALDGDARVVRLALPPGTTSHAFASPVPANARVVWRIRVRDAAGALSPWSETESFIVQHDPDPPSPPSGLSVLPLDGAVQLAWTASASPDVVGYNVYRQAGGTGFAQAEVARLGIVTAMVANGLTNGAAVDFLVTAVDGAGNESAGVLVTATPRPDILLAGRDGFLSVQQAVDAAAPGETVELGPKTFRVAGGLVLKGGVSLRGYAPHLTVLDGQGAPAVLRLAGTAADGRVAVENLTLTGGAAGIDTGDADVRLRNLQIVQIAGPGIVTGSMGAVDGAFLTVADNAGDGIVARTPLAAFRGIIAARNGGAGLAGRPDAAVTYSAFFANTLGPASPGIAIDDTPGAPPRGNRSIPMAFRDPASFDYRERTGDAAVDAADPDDPWDEEPEPNGLRANQGAFGNTPYAAKSLVLPSSKADDGIVPEEGDAGRPLCFVAASGSNGTNGRVAPTGIAMLLLAAGFALRRRA